MAARGMSLRVRVLLLLFVRLLVMSRTHAQIIASRPRATEASVVGGPRTPAVAAVARKAASAAGSRLFDVDGYEAGNECFVDGDNYPSDRFTPTANGTSRGDWKKCLPVYYPAIANALGRSGEAKLSKLYAQLSELHHRLCTHVVVDVGGPGSAVVEKMGMALHGVGDFAESRAAARQFLNDAFRLLFRYIDTFRFNDALFANGEWTSECAKSESGVTEYSLHTVELGIGVDDGKLSIDKVRIQGEPEDNALSADFQVCEKDDEGVGCFWIIDEEQLYSLPPRQQPNFSNTKIHRDIATLFDERRALTWSHFTGEPGQGEVTLNDRRVRKIAAGELFIHCHLGYKSSAMLRTFTYQHDAERAYPGKVQKVCFCNRALLAQVVEQCDCTLSHEANDGCSWAGANVADDASSVVADARGYFKGIEPPVCCANCVDGDGARPPCYGAYDYGYGA